MAINEGHYGDYQRANRTDSPRDRQDSKNKATNAHIGKLKAKIAQLKLKEEKAMAHSKASGGGKGFEVKKSGDATVALVGFPSVGKSTLDFKKL